MRLTLFEINSTNSEMSNDTQTPRKINLLILDEATMLTVASVLDPLRAANRLAGRTVFEWQIYSRQGNPVRMTGNFELLTDGAFTSARSGEILIVIASFNQHIHASTNLIQTLRRAAGQYRLIVGVEAGTWLLARSGIARDHRVTTHWEDVEDMASRYPDLDVRRDRFVTDRKLWTCGGASPALDMMLKLVEMHAGKALALEIASVFIYDQTHAPGDSQPSLSLGKIEALEPRIAMAVRLMENHRDNPLPVPAIARRAGLSTRMLEILFRRHLGQTPGSYYLRLRLLGAQKMLRDTPLSVQEIAMRSGFSSQSAFSRAFRRAFGSNPGALRTAAQ